MIGRFVKHQQIGFFPGNEREGEAGLFAARHRRNFGFGEVARKAIGAEEVAQFLLSGVWRQMPKMLERRFIHPQLIELVLRKITNFKSLTAAQFARHGGEFSDNGFDQRRFARAVDAENADALARTNAEGDARKHHFVAVADLQVFPVDQMLGQPQGLEKIESPFAFGAYGFDRLKLFEHFDARLCLTGFAGLGTEAFNKARQVRCLRFISAAGKFLGAEFFNAREFKLGVVPGIAADRAVFNGPDRIDRTIEEFTVVRNDDDCRFNAPEPVLEPDERIDVEVVRGFVKEQQIRRAHQRTGELNTVAPAAREVVNFAAAVGFCKTQTGQNGFGLCHHGTLIDFGEFAVRGSKRHFVAGGFGPLERCFGVH